MSLVIEYFLISHSKKVQLTNGAGDKKIESKRRTQIVGVFPDQGSLYMTDYIITTHGW